MTRRNLTVTLNIARLTSGLSDLRGDQGTTEQPSDLSGADSSKGTVFDVSGNKAYGPEGSYKVFAGKDASRALAQSSLKTEECRPEWEDLSDDHKKVLNDWYTFFSKRYNIKGRVEGAVNM
ncbi:hypothetical protein LTR12_005797 [Friedmanniomyces endolithicus]|nr:hypothetical protein LTR74_013487 [Friedmanniomyces endolithicus]KAK1819771.1 hypothetical protein LTR12_005797 [Friedmanniomyces endolithicus]